MLLNGTVLRHQEVQPKVHQEKQGLPWRRHNKLATKDAAKLTAENAA
jgi:hypothetical protein